MAIQLFSWGNNVFKQVKNTTAFFLAKPVPVDSAVEEEPKRVPHESFPKDGVAVARHRTGDRTNIIDDVVERQRTTETKNLLSSTASYQSEQFFAPLCCSVSWSNLYTARFKGMQFSCQGYPAKGGTNPSQNVNRKTIPPCHKEQHGKIIAIASSWQHVCVAMDTGKLLFWEHGRFYDNPLCLDSNSNAEYKVTEVRSLVGGEHHFVLLGADGQIGIAEVEERVLAYRVVPLSAQACQVSCGKEHTLVLTDTGLVYSFGLGSRGQLGHDSTDQEVQPKLVDALDGLKIIAVAAGGWHSLALSDIGDVYTWGWNESGQLGLPSLNRISANKEVTPSQTECSAALDSTKDYNGSDSLVEESFPPGQPHRMDALLNNEEAVLSQGIKVSVPQTTNDEVTEDASELVSMDSIDVVSPTADFARCDMKQLQLKQTAIVFQCVPTLLDFPGSDEILVTTISCGSRHSALVTGVLLLCAR
ncbi:PREDICTED: uncharacterized protein LOC106806607 isoform X2 [Priapulus caudatus]|uniref:Uncharacterized protein LOC106806607 isoform X2 n=1 Tax=Priapulus caudatus TaxID=37621 RepID=A0ABM1DVW9_PRICU|nr:PREDICTED: uncharacterized protein LOC106806607 isoform X2 [Priapulus caudatus]